ncbi:MAG: restriction endonuclease [Mycobacteriales bacterium]
MKKAAFLDKVFNLFDMEPRLQYQLEHEQIDGSVSFDTDDYIVEAKWHKSVIERRDVDAFAQVVGRKVRDALGIYVSVNGFSTGVLQEYHERSSFLAIDGHDLICVLEQRVRLDDLIKRKKRHVNETGSCYYPAARMIAD